MVRPWQEPVRTTDRTPVLVCDGKRRSVAPVCAPCRAGLRAVRSPPCIVSCGVVSCEYVGVQLNTWLSQGHLEYVVNT